MNSAKMKLFKHYYTAGHYGVDNEGRLVIVERVGFYDYKAMATDYTREELEDFFIQLQERMLFIEFPILSELSNKRIARNIVILDLKNLQLPKLFHKKFRLFMDVAIASIKDYYPETLDKSIFINAPFGAPATWKIIKLLLDPKTAAKFEMFSDNGQEYLSKILKVENLPVEIGGKNIVSLQYGYGPYIDEIKKSYQSKTVFLSDREIEYKWFYTEEERKVLEKESQSTMATTQDKLGFKQQYSYEVSQSAINASSLNKSQRISISHVRVNTYFNHRNSFK